jgi:hypothetical protein
MRKNDLNENTKRFTDAKADERVFLTNMYFDIGYFQ